MWLGWQDPDAPVAAGSAPPHEESSQELFLICSFWATVGDGWRSPSILVFIVGSKVINAQ